MNERIETNYNGILGTYVNIQTTRRNYVVNFPFGNGEAKMNVLIIVHEYLVQDHTFLSDICMFQHSQIRNESRHSLQTYKSLITESLNIIPRKWKSNNVVQ